MKKCLLLLGLISFLPLLRAQLPRPTKFDRKAKAGFYEVERIQELRLRFSAPNWADQLDSLRLAGKGTLAADLQVGEMAFREVGVRYRGGKSFRAGNPRNALHLKLDAYVEGQNAEGRNTIKLSNALRDPSMVREVLGYEMARQYLPAPEANFVRLYINEEYWGLFVNVEPIDSLFLEKHFGASDGTLVKARGSEAADAPADCKKRIYASLEYEANPECYPHNFELKSAEGWEAVQALTQHLRVAAERKPSELAELLNVDRALWMLAFNNVLVNLNSYTGQYSQNYYLYRDSLGQFNPILWDLNLAFGSFKNTGRGSDLDLAGLQQLDPLLHADNPRKPLIASLLAQPLYRKIYLAHVRTLVYEQLLSGRYLERARALQELIKVSFINDPHKYYVLADFQNSLEQTIGRRSKIPGIGELMEVRASYLKKHPEIVVVPPEVSTVKVLRREKFAAEPVRDFRIQAKVDKLPKRVKLYYRFDPREAYREVYMADDGRSDDGEAGDKTFGVRVLPPEGADTLEYFILTENARAVSFYPSQYMRVPLKVGLAEIN
ncbi:MAG: CotH kinase family protein [Bacteroidota bacterium]